MGQSAHGSPERFPLRALAAKQAVPWLVVLAALPLCWPYLKQMDLAAGWAAMTALAPWQWAVAALATVISFLAVGRYDAEVHQVLKTGQSPATASEAGMVGIAISQTTGMGIVIGTLVRWRMLPGASLGTVLGVNALVSGAFFLGWAVVTALVVLVLPLDVAWAKAAASLVLLAALGLGALALWAPRVGGRPLPLPPLRRMGSLTGWIGLDLGMAALAFWVLLPQGSTIGFTELLPLFLIAAAAGMIGGTPAGIGPFEVMLLGLMPSHPTEPLVCALLAFRLVYYVGPAILALVRLSTGPVARPAPQAGIRPAHDLTPACKARFLDLKGPAEHGLIHQGQHALIPVQAGGWLTQALPQTQVAVFDPAGRVPPATALEALRQAALPAGLVPAVYKASGRVAAAARQAGWQVQSVGQEAIVTPQAFDLSQPAHRQMRRKLRQAQKAGLVCAAEAASPELDALDAAWRAHNGAARGLSMGRYCLNYLAQQEVFVARLGGEAVGFVSLHAKPGEWTLDLMRQGPGAPDGTMHQLVLTAIQAARAAGIARLSLAAVPHTAPSPGLAGRVAAHLGRIGGAKGLRQFKAAFAPRWEARYLLAPSKIGLALAGWDIARALTDPAPLRQAPLAAHENKGLQTLLTKFMKSLNLRLRAACGSDTHPTP